MLIHHGSTLSLFFVIFIFPFHDGWFCESAGGWEAHPNPWVPPPRAPGWDLIETYLYWLMQSTSRSLNMKNWVWKKEEKSIIWINMYWFRPHLRPLPRSLLDICMNNGLLTDGNYHRCFFIKGGRMAAISASLDSRWPIREHAEVTMVTVVSVLNVDAALPLSSFPLLWYTLLCIYCDVSSVSSFMIELLQFKNWNLASLK